MARQLTSTELRTRLITAGVKNLKRFGYSHVDETNILTDTVYRAFFKSMLESEENVTSNKDVEQARQDLLKELI